MAAQAGKGRQPTMPEYECGRAASPIAVDGRGDEEAWRRAPTIETFAAHWLDRPARSRTRARLVWDDDYLYFFADMDDVDLYADRTEHDDKIWLNDVFELFFKPSENELGYYEFQVNAANATLDTYLPSRGSGGYDRWVKADPFEFDSAVALRGTLRRPRSPLPASHFRQNGFGVVNAQFGILLPQGRHRGINHREYLAFDRDVARVEQLADRRLQATRGFAQFAG